jgi:hypothetical protein
MPNKVVLGPILGFRGLKNGRWCTSALVVVEGDWTQPQLKFTVDGGAQQNEDKAIGLKIFGNRHVWRLEWAVKQTNSEQWVDFAIDGGAGYRYVVPEIEKPLRIAYATCFGFSTLKFMNQVAVKNAMWTVLQEKYEEKPYHLMMAGGDQIYADLMWETIPVLKDWAGKSFEKRKQASFTPAMQEAVAEFYFNLYCERWSQPEPAAVFSRIPQIMMWDDHDIFDGWGSYPPEQQECAVFKGIYEIAREHFRLFQLQAKEDADLGDFTLLGQPAFTYGHRIGDLGILALDMRSERTPDQVMSRVTWDRVYQWMDDEIGKNAASPCKHLVVMSSIPVVYINSNMLEAALGWMPGQQELEDDFKDQWVSRTHMEERLRLIHRLLLFSKEAGCRVTIVSGDVHVAALGYIESTRDPEFDEANVVNQLISSAMNHPPPSGLIIYMMEKVMGDKVEEVDRGITARMLKFPGSSQRFIGKRNWLSLTFDDKNRIWGEWYAEDEATPYTKVIHPVGALTS